MIRVLQCVNIMDRAGLENMLMNYYRKIDRNEIQFDFLTHREEKGAYDDEIVDLGGQVYHAPRLYPQNYPSYFRWMKCFFGEHPEYEIIHSHIDAMSYFPLLAAKKAGVPFRIAHSHSSKLDKDLKLPIKFAAMKLLPTVANRFCACGEVAGHFMFGRRDFTIIRNAVDIGKFEFNPNVRERKRKGLDLTGKFVIGHVGRYCYIKNQLFLLEVFKLIKKEKKDAYLLLVGKGEDEQKIRRTVSMMGLDNSVSLLIDRSDVDELYQAMDIFVMPSLFEGLPVVGVEAQANGLPVIVSSNISKEILLSDNIEMMNLDAGADVWKDAIIGKALNRNPLATEQLQNKGYSIEKEAGKLAEFYRELK